MRIRAYLLVFALSLTACGPTQTPDSKPRGHVDRSSFGEKWPLTVESGQLQCQIIRAGGYKLEAVTLLHDGKLYGLNGVAKSHLKAMDIDPIWAAPPPQWITLKSGERVNAAAPKKSLGPLLEAGRAICSA